MGESSRTLCYFHRHWNGESWRVKESDGGWDRGMLKLTKKREEVIFKSTSRRGATARLVMGPLNGRNLRKNVDNETKRT